MGECRDCAYSSRPIYKWPCDVCRDTKNGRSMYCPEEADHIAKDERKTDYNSMNYLKACPFCGGKAVFRSTTYHFIDGAILGNSVIEDANEDHEEFFVYCTKCRVMQYLTYKTPEEAAKNWNERR